MMGVIQWLMLVVACLSPLPDLRSLAIGSSLSCTLEEIAASVALDPRLRNG